MVHETLEDRVRFLIEESGQTNEAFAAAVGLDPTKLSKSLNGKRRFTSLDLAKIATLGEVTVDWLLLGDQISMAVAARVAKDGSSVSMAVREAQALAEARENLVFLGHNQDWPKPPLPRSFLWIDQGKELADFALKQIGSPGDLDLQEFATAIEQTLGVDVRVMPLGSGCDGVAMCGEAARVLVVATSENPTRQRFTMAHELAHLLCRDDQDLHVDEDVMARTGGTDSSEMRANAFAAALLMPEALLRSKLSGSSVTDDEFAEIVMQLVVSPSSLAWRLLNLGIVTEPRRRELGRTRTIDCAARTGRMSEYAKWVEESSQPRVPVRLVQDSLQAYLDGHSTLRPVAQLLRVPVDVLRQAVEQGEPNQVDGDLEFQP